MEAFVRHDYLKDHRIIGNLTKSVFTTSGYMINILWFWDLRSTALTVCQIPANDTRTNYQVLYLIFFGRILTCLNCQLKYTTFDFTTPQTVLVVAAALVGQWYVALNWRILVITGCKQNHINLASGYKKDQIQVSFDWRSFDTTWYWVILVVALRHWVAITSSACQECTSCRGNNGKRHQEKAPNKDRSRVG